MNNQYKKDIITCYESIWNSYGKIPTVELVLEAYKEMKNEEVNCSAAGSGYGI